MVLDRFVSMAGERFAITSKRPPYELADFKFKGHRLFLLKPLTYMNKSGEAVSSVARFYRFLPHEILVVHDDIDMPLGRLKFVKDGGAGGHNGVRSVIALLGTKDFVRLKIGIGRPGDGMPVDVYVLSPFTQSEQTVVEVVVEKAAEALSCFIAEGVDTAMNRFNGMMIQ